MSNSKTIVSAWDTEQYVKCTARPDILHENCKIREVIIGTYGMVPAEVGCAPTSYACKTYMLCAGDSDRITEKDKT